jgi:endonuclease/exonuclease/phosphatase family metal-dependent hydrolase
MEDLGKFKILNWNIAGAKYLEKGEYDRLKFREELNEELKTLIKREQPDVVTLQEIVRYVDKKTEILDTIDGYDFHAFPLIDTENLSIRAKWNKLEKSGGWPKGTYFAQGNGFLIKKDIHHQPVWDLPKKGRHHPRVLRNHYIEKVGLESGLYFGDRDTEPRAALVAHFVYNPRGKPLDIFVINLHLTTLTKEREGIPDIDKKATKIRLAQLDVIFDGIISRYNSWRRWGFREREEYRDPEDWENFDREEPVWIMAGDFNSTEQSHEYRMIQDLNFMDMIPAKGKGTGTKASGTGKEATLTLDYIFAGPKFVSLDSIYTEAGIQQYQNKVLSEVRVSDHFPMIATIPIYR